ncbi:hypothetical protein ACGTN9_16685 [Halobacillus sp. MO56]
MRKVLLTAVLFSILLAGCTSEEEKLVNELKSNVEGKYNVVAFKDDMPPEAFQSLINETFTIEQEEVWEATINSFEILEEIPTEPYHYGQALNITQLPEFIVFDTEGITYRTNDIRAMEAFFVKNFSH